MGFSIWQFFDILLIAYLLYAAHKTLRGTAAFNVLLVIGLFVVLNWFFQAMGMRMISSVLQMVAGVGSTALIVIFQPEIRRFLFGIARRTRYQLDWTNRYLGATPEQKDRKKRDQEIEILQAALLKLSSEHVGALVVLSPPDIQLADVQIGVPLDALLTQDLIRFVFHKKSPFHDGAALVTNGRVAAVSCILPVSDNRDLPAWAGLRHRAAIGATEINHVAVLIVSEENGNISFALEGQLQNDLDAESLKEILQQYYA
jgi:uncharacterized protein (TIGR00159 family)